METYRARLHGFTGWLNSILVGKMETTNISNSLVEGNCLQLLLQSLTGETQKRIQSLDGLTENQKVLRIDWFVEILKKEHLLPKAYRIDSAKFVKKIADTVFPLLSYLVLFHLICIKDVLTKFLTVMNQHSILKHSLNFTSKHLNEICKTSSDISDYQLEDISLSIINRILRQDKYTKRHLISDLSELADSRVLCALINFFIPGCLTSEILISDRWTISLCLECATKALRINFQMEIPDFFSGDNLALSSFVAGIVLRGLKFNQSSIASSRAHKLEIQIRDCKSQLEWMEQSNATQALTLLTNTIEKLHDQMSAYQKEYDTLANYFNLTQCKEWCEHVTTMQKQIRSKILDQMKIRFDRIQVPGPMTINEFCDEYAINLALTGNIGFYRPVTKENIWPDRKMVLYDLKEKVYYDNFTGLLEPDDLYKHLGFSTPGKLEELLPSKYEKNLEIFLSSSSKNKKLIPNSLFLYQVFPGTRSQCEKLLHRACRNGEKTAVEKLLTFFDNDSSFLNSKDLNGNTGLHHAAKNNHFEVCHVLIENGATVDIRNTFYHTPLYVAAEAIHRDICLLLLEWCSNPNLKDRNSKTLYDVVRNTEMKSAITTKRQWILKIQDMCAKQNIFQICKIFTENPNSLISNRSRFFAGMTIMHIWAKFHLTTLIESFAGMQVDINLLDSAGKTPIHYSSKKTTIQLLLKWGGNIFIRDHKNNTPLHTLCSTPLAASETSNDVIDKQTCLLYMIEQGLSPLDCNSEGLLPIHSACTVGLDFLIDTMLNSETGPEIDEYIRSTTIATPDNVYSPLYYAILNQQHSCIKLLVKRGLLFAPTEATTLLYKLLKSEFSCTDKLNMAHFLLNNGANIWHTFPECNNTTFLHIISAEEPSTIINIFLDAGAEVNAIDKFMQTPFIVACQKDNDYAAAKLANKGADIFRCDKWRKTAFDYIPNHEQWIRRGQFSDNIDIINRLRGYSLSKARDMVSKIATAVDVSQVSNLRHK